MDEEVEEEKESNPEEREEDQAESDNQGNSAEVRRNQKRQFNKSKMFNRVVKGEQIIRQEMMDVSNRPSESMEDIYGSEDEQHRSKQELLSVSDNTNNNIQNY